MTTVHENAATSLLDEFMSDPDGVKAMAIYSAGFADGRWSDDWRDFVHQHHRDERPAMEQLAAFARIHSDLMSGSVAWVDLTTFGETPRADRERAANSRSLAALPRPFIAEVDPVQNCADEDGYLRWAEPISMQVSTGSAICRPDGSAEPQLSVITVPPGRVPLEIGTTMASKTLWHLQRDRGLARWPYGYDSMRLFVSVGPSWQRRIGL